MSLPPGFIDELRARVSLASVAGRKVTWDSRKSNQGKGDYWAPCPFHQEKTASFHVDDKQGFYYCFGCHAKGDALNFLKETENLGFMESVEMLASQAGMEMPARDPQAAARAKEQATLVDVMEEAVRFYRLQLKTVPAKDARAYLVERGLNEDAQKRFEIGFAPEGNTVGAHLKAKNIPEQMAIDAGLIAMPDDGRGAYDRFRGRIMFPIRDARGRAIAFGGRSQDPNARAKYLNSPETQLFDKGRTLYNQAPARAACGKGQTLVVAEGYMDVIALVEAGFTASVAPLGTAITTDQLHLLWRMSPEPIIALDGDTAGLRAAMRVIDMALPLLEAGRSVRFALMPEGKDPDDVLKAGGIDAMRALIDASVPMVDLLWRRETERKSFDSPERRAALDAVLRSAVAKITDGSIRGHYVAAIREKRREIFTVPRPNSGFFDKRKKTPVAVDTTRSSTIARVSESQVRTVRESVVLAICLTHSDILHDFETRVETMHFDNDGHKAIHRSILHHMLHPTSDLLAAVSAGFPDGSVEKLMLAPHVRIVPAIRKSEDKELARQALIEELDKLDAERGMQQELADAVHDMESFADEGLTWRLSQASAAKANALKSELDEAQEVGEDRQEMSKHLQNLIDGEVWVKKKK